MNDALKQTAGTEALAEKPAEKFPDAVERENSAEVPERLPKPQTSFLETVYYWVIARS